MTKAFPRRPGLIGLCLVFAAHAVDLRPAAAAVFVVNSVADTDDGDCAAAPAGCTLREAIIAANAAAGPDTITFDPAVFTLGTPQVITVLSALPRLAEPAGNVVDGRGASVVIDGVSLDPVAADPGLVIESGSAAPLSHVAVHQLVVRNFAGDGLLICGGVFPDCDAEVAGALVSAVTATTNGDNGIAIDGDPNVGTRVEDSLASGNQSSGIRLNGEDLVKATVEDCSSSANAGRGINLNAGRDNVAATVIRSVAVENANTGINVNAGSAVSKARVFESVAASNGSGIVLNAGSDLTKATVKDNTAAENVSDGIVVEGSASKLIGNRATRNGGAGIVLKDPGGGNRIEKNHAAGNGAAGITVEDGNGNNRIKQNVALGNVPDLADELLGCDANIWQKNVFASTGQPCIQ